MSAAILDGGALAKKIKLELPARAARFAQARARAPHLSILAGDHPSAKAYCQSKLKACKASGIKTSTHPLSGSTQTAVELVRRLSQDDAVDGIIVELPLPAGMELEKILSALSPLKDVEAVTPVNYGRLALIKSYEETVSRGLVVPCTAAAVINLLLESKVPIAKKQAVVVGRSNILGKPTAQLLTALNATVTLCHSQTENIEEHIRRADIVVAGLGRPRFVKAEWLKPGAIVIDAGITLEGTKMIGDVDFEPALKVASYITPVPGGVGPVTTAMLLCNTLLLAESRLG